MTARRALVTAAVVVVAVVTLLALRPGPSGSGDPGPAGAIDPAVPVTRPAPTGPPEGVAATVAGAPPTTGRPPATRPAAGRPPATRPATGRPAPFVQTFAAQPGVRPLPAKPSPTKPVPVPVNVDGCDRGYGTRTQCVPWTFPAAATDKCAWLAARGFTRLTVHGPDRHKLDPNQDGIACD